MLRTASILLIGCVVSMGIAFATTRYLLHGSRFLQGAHAITVEQANALRELANEQLALAEQLRQQAESNPAGLGDWATNVLAPSLRAHRQHLDAAGPLPAVPRSYLMEGRRRLESVVQAPQDAPARNGAIAAARDTWADVEHYIETMRTGSRLSAPKRVPFR